MNRMFGQSGSARWGALALLALMFLAGGFAGAAWERTRDHGPRRRSERDADTTNVRRIANESNFERPMRDSGRGRRGGMSRFPWFYDSLGLSERQRASIDSIMRSNRPRTDQVMASVMPQLRAISDSTRVAIDAVLTPEQLAKLKAMPRRDFRRGPGFGDRGERRDPAK